MMLSKQTVNPEIESSWKALLQENFNNDSFLSLKKFLKNEKSSQTIYPPGKEIFTAFNKTPFENVKVVIIGQDPYHGQDQAHGLCFSVPQGIKSPPSLVNIFKEMQSDIGTSIPNHGNLEKWAKEGVLLLNATLTVRAGQAGSHQGKGWEEFTNTVISKLSSNKQNLVFLLWGKFAQEKSILIDDKRHYILKAAHPSPFSAHNGFFGCKHFSKTNDYLVEHGMSPVNWDLNS